uniref:Uncharacterized protein n=1 Tax=viral metagenome TaxID=1070528 RepID=A0A6M3MCJ7_9ZZZZ
MTREVTQEYDCPHSMDFDLEGDSLVYKGQRFHCSGCRGEHTAGVDVEVSTMVEDGEDRSWPDLPESAEALRALMRG